MSSPRIGDGMIIPGSSTGKPLAEKSSVNVSHKGPVQEPVLAKLAESTGKNPTREFFSQTATALGLPVDRLSITLLAILRFFSLPLNQAALLRREFLATHKSGASLPASAASAASGASGLTKEKALLEIKALVLTAAFDKGVILSSEALERYSRLLASPVFTEDFAEDHAEHGENETTDGGAMSGRGGKDSKTDHDEVPDREELQAIAEKEAKEDRLLDFLNVLPGKNGQYWVVFPFKITVKGTELKVFIRLLNKEDYFKEKNENLIVDIAGPRRQYRCFLKKNSGKLRADIRVFPKLAEKALKLLTKKAESFLGEISAFEEILVRNEDEASTWVEDLYAEYLPSINEEV